MKAITLKTFGGVENLETVELPIPEIAANEVLVQVKSISINPVDVKTRAGKGMAGRLKELDPLILGWDISGIVTASNAPDFKVEDEVFGMVNFPGHGKAYAEFVAVPADQLAIKPANINFEEAAAATLAALTAWQALVVHAKIQEGQKVLIHSAAGGVGHYAVQLAKYLGAYVVGTASAENKEFVLSLGADEHIDYKASPFEEQTSDIDFVLDTIGGDNIDRSLKIIKKGGSLITIPSGLSDGVAEKGKAVGVNAYFFLVESNGAHMKEIAALLEKGIIKSHVSSVFPFEEMGQAHLQVETAHTRGKVVVSTDIR
ncbi:NADP-dependent oxidoreductase [Dyadobacter sp. CY326]|uniref:NADP-dependent oxidoreductase n=1 Tax=Dyadobacter sp. CY326 TaxID=2907300 RepID=UPI001F2CCA1F|nr:NADP-dependent oxidoreductase [Dyadobacter sp. CY326]MCE7066925.1 NADP-dependent oxidoreductase [Dyadobacter sp. CY326]